MNKEAIETLYSIMEETYSKLPKETLVKMVISAIMIVIIKDNSIEPKREIYYV